MTEQTSDLVGDVTKVEGDVQAEKPVVESVTKQDAVAMEATVAAGMELGHRAEDVIEILKHLWERGIGVFMHSQPASIAGDAIPEHTPPAA